MRNTSGTRFVRLVLIAGMLASRLPGQGDRGVITGTITDASGAIVPGAAITVIQKDTNTSFKTTTSTAGDFTDKRSDLGYLFQTELRSGELPAYGVEFRAFDDVAPVEDWGLRSGEVGWADEGADVDVRLAAAVEELLDVGGEHAEVPRQRRRNRLLGRGAAAAGRRQSQDEARDQDPPVAAPAVYERKHGSLLRLGEWEGG